MSGKHKALHHVVLVLVGIAVVALVGVRIWYVNATAYRPKVELYGTGDEVAMDGSFLGQQLEAEGDYSITIQDAERMSFNEYVERYGVDGEAYKPSSDAMVHDGGLDGEDVVVVDMAVTNHGGEDGYIAALNWRLVAQDRPAATYLGNFDLLRTSEPGLSVGYFAVAPGHTHVLHMPFCAQRYGPASAPSNEKHYTQADTGLFSLNITNYPVQKTVEFDVAP
ncbi:MAG TPA: hypothetical protein IAC01_00805 [Candidatus Limicola stercorigallinarum]|nr:hypothetical protein [Candidatus Limicola stercorigallinarum]